jgi:hypothetical protein
MGLWGYAGRDPPHSHIKDSPAYMLFDITGLGKYLSFVYLSLVLS